MKKRANTNIAIGSAFVLFCAACGGDHSVTGPSPYSHPPETRQISLTLVAAPQHLVLGDPVILSVWASGAPNCKGYLYLPSGLKDTENRVIDWRTSSDGVGYMSTIREPISRGVLTATAVLVERESNVILAKTSVVITVQ